MTNKGKKKVDFIVRPKLTKEDLPPTPEQWVEKGKETDTHPEEAVDVRPEKPADDRPEKDEKWLTLNLSAKLHTAFKSRCVLKNFTIQKRVTFLIDWRFAK